MTDGLSSGGGDGSDVELITTSIGIEGIPCS